VHQVGNYCIVNKCHPVFLFKFVQHIGATV